MRVYKGESNAWNVPFSSRDEPEVTMEEEVMEVVPRRESPSGSAVARKGRKRNASSREGKTAKNGVKASKEQPTSNTNVRQMQLTQMFAKG